MPERIENLTMEQIANFYIELFTAQEIIDKSIQSIRRRSLETLDRDEYNELRSEQLPWLKLQDNTLTNQQYQFEHGLLRITPPTNDQITEIEALSGEVSGLQRRQELYSNAVNLTTRAVGLYNSTQA